jgi:hypothetical protein
MNIFLQVNQHPVLMIRIKTIRGAATCKVHHRSIGLHVAVVSMVVAERLKHVDKDRV